MSAGRSSTNRSTALSHLGLVLSAVYLNLTIDKANASGEHHHTHASGGYLPPVVIPTEMWPEILTRIAIGGVRDDGGLADYYARNGGRGYATDGAYGYGANGVLGYGAGAARGYGAAGGAQGYGAAGGEHGYGSTGGAHGYGAGAAHGYGAGAAHGYGAGAAHGYGTAGGAHGYGAAGGAHGYGAGGTSGYGANGAQGYGANGYAAKGAQGYGTNGGFYNDLFAKKNAYDVGKGYGRGYDYGQGSVQGGGFRDLGGRNTGHTASGFSNSYRKDESGDRSSYYDDGLGHKGMIKYGAGDNRYRDQGGSLGRAGYHNSNLKRYGGQANGKYGDTMTYSQGGDSGVYLQHGRYGYPRHGRLMTNKSTGVYIIPMPSKLFIDQTPPPI